MTLRPLHTTPRPRDDRWVGATGRTLQVVIVVYMLVILAFVWTTKELAFASLRSDPIFAGYSLAVVCYILGRFFLSLAYRPVRRGNRRPTVSVIVPAFNEEAGIAGTLRSCLSARYPHASLEVIAINDGSTDRTWDRILEVKRDHPELYAVHLGGNYGKRAAMAEGIRRARGEILLFVDSDSYLARDAVEEIVKPFEDRRVGAVVGHADVANDMTNWLTKMQQVRYYSAFRVIKGTESLLSGAVTCASGCCSAYRRDVLLTFLDEWEHQVFLGRPATFGDDRALTNRVLQGHRVVYQSTARSTTHVPESLSRFLRQQLRWKKSWLRESLQVVRYFWRKNPLAALLTYASILFPFLAPFVVTRAVLNGFDGGGNRLWFYLIGTYAMALLYSLYYALTRRTGLWYHGMTFVAIYMSVLVFQTYWGIATMRDTRWGTRDSTVEHRSVDRRRMIVHPPSLPWTTSPAEQPAVVTVAGS
ncbi:MAG TPA: glycosyltransferase [Acidimicrobiia bacterium]|nr:glycosyltransferase [Acidimicrobiia bacterium]